jgi:magnesium transporter
VNVEHALYRDGRREPEAGSLSDAIEAGEDRPETFVWVDLVGPSAAELEELAAAYGLHPLAVEDALHAHQRPKIERYGDGLLLVLKTLRWPRDADEIEVGEVLVLVGTSYVITVRHGTADVLAGVRERLEGDTEHLAHGPAAVVHAVADAAVDGYDAVLSVLEAELDAVEEVVFAAGRGDHAERLYGLRREVQAARRAVDPLVDVTERLVRTRGLHVGEDLQVYFRDVQDHVIRSRDRLATIDVLSNSAFDAHLAQVAIQQNDDMRRISAWVGIAAAPTLIAGVYGMNFENMPELSWRFGYPAVLGLIATVCLSLYTAFRRNGWL